MTGTVLSMNVGGARGVYLPEQSRAGELLAAEALSPRWRRWAERAAA